MPLSSIVRQLQSNTLTAELAERSHRQNRLLIRGGGRAARALVASAIAKKENCPLLVVPHEFLHFLTEPALKDPKIIASLVKDFKK